MDFDIIIDEYGDMVYRIALSHTLDRHYAEDIFQDVFLKLFRHQHKIKDSQHLKYWLIRTAINISVDYNRRKNRIQITPAENMNYTDETAFQELKLITEALPDKFRSVIYLCLFEGYSSKETAKILNIREGTVKSRLYRAKQILKKELEE